MATAKKLQSGSWRCQVYSHTEEIIQPDGTTKQKRIYKSFTCDIPGPKGKRMAEKMAADWAANKESRKTCSIAIGQAIDEYVALRSSVLSPGTIREYKRMRKSNMQGIMNIKIDAITQEQIQKEINRESLSHSPKTVRNMHGLLSAIMRSYRPDFALNTALPKKIQPNLYIPTDDDVKKLMDCVAGTEMEMPVLLAAFGPMRRGEIAALESDHVNGNIVHVEYSIALDENNNWVKKSPKSISGNRYIEFPDFIAQKLSKIDGKITNLTPGQISDHFISVIQKNNLPKFRFHDLRHYCASMQHALGIPDVYIMQRGGWHSDAVLKNVYRHALEDQAKKMNEIANKHFSEICNTNYNTK